MVLSVSNIDFYSNVRRHGMGEGCKGYVDVVKGQLKVTRSKSTFTLEKNDLSNTKFHLGNN